MRCAQHSAFQGPRHGSWVMGHARSCEVRLPPSSFLLPPYLIPPLSSLIPMVPSLLPVTVVGSYPQPDWLIDRKLLAQGVPRVRMRELWRIAPERLEEAQDDATLLAIRDMERAGIDIVTDGEMRRE